MLRRALFFIAVPVVLSGCASLRDYVVEDPNAPSLALVAKQTAAQSYAAGVDAMVRGDYEGARRAWDRCLASARPDSAEALDCLVARERLAEPSADSR